MSTLTVEVNTGTEASPTWTTVDADEAKVVKRRGRGGYATFRIPNADISDRTGLRTGRLARVHLERGSDEVWFKGMLLEHRVISDGAGVFSIEATVGELAERAKYFPITTGDDDVREYPQELETVTETEFIATEDATVKSDAATTNFGTDTTLTLVKSVSATDLSLIKFDISGLSSADVILDAKIRLFVQAHERSGVSVTTLRTVVLAYKVLETWSEGTVTWNTRPDLDSDADPDTGEGARLAEFDILRAGVEHLSFVTGALVDYFKEIHAGTTDNYGVAFGISPWMPDSEITVVSSESSASALRPTLILQHQPSVLISDVVEDLFDNYWGDVDITGIQATAESVELMTVTPEREDAEARVEGIRFDRFDNLYDAMELLTNQVPGWEWWLDTSDGDDIVLHFEEADQGTPAEIGEADIGHPFEMEPENLRVINHVIVLGPAADPDQPDRVIAGEARSAASQTIFGYRFQLFQEPTLASRQLLNARAAAILHETQSEYWTVAVDVAEHRDLLPGSQVTLDLSTYGVDGTNFEQDFVVEETGDTFERGYWTRQLVLREYLP